MLNTPKFTFFLRIGFCCCHYIALEKIAIFINLLVFNSNNVFNLGQRYWRFIYFDIFFIFLIFRFFISDSVFSFTLRFDLYFRFLFQFHNCCCYFEYYFAYGIVCIQRIIYYYISGMVNESETKRVATVW